MSDKSYSKKSSVKDVLSGLKATHTNMVILEMVRTTLEDGYCGATGKERSGVFERKVYALIQAEQHRLWSVLDQHTDKILNLVQHE